MLGVLAHQGSHHLAGSVSASESATTPSYCSLLSSAAESADRSSLPGGGASSVGNCYHLLSGNP